MSYLTKADRERDYNNVVAYAKKVAMQQGLAEGLEKGLAEGRKEGRKEGLEKGRQEEKIEAAKKMLVKGFAIDMISEILDLSADEIEKLT